MKKFLLLCLVAIYAFTAWSYDFEDNGIYYKKLSDTTVEVTHGGTYASSGTLSYSGNVVVPENVENESISYTVSSVGNNAFYNCVDLESITLPSTIEKVDWQGFSKCAGLTTFYSLNPTPPECVKGLGINGQEGTYDNFDGIDMDVCILYVPIGSVSDYSVANGWSNFKNIEEIEEEGTPLADGTKFQVDGIYYNVVSSTDKTVYVTYGGESTTSGTSSYIGDISIPERVKYEQVTYTVVGIESKAFYSCVLTSVTTPATVAEIGNMAFAYCSLLKSVSLSEGLLSIGIETFRECSALNEIDIPNSVTLLNSYAFRDCTNLKHATLGNGLTSISNCTFYECSSLEEITIPKNVTLVNMQAFYNCTSLMSVTSLNTTPPETFAYVFSGVDTDACVLYVPHSAVDDYAKASTWQDFTHIVGIADEVGDRIEVDGIFYDIVSTTDNTIEVTWGGDSSTSGTETYIGDISIPSTVDYGNNTYTVVGIGENAFRNCEELTNVTMPESATYIGEYAFRGTAKMATVEIGSGVTTLGIGAFYECGLTEVVIPASITTADDYAFAYSENLEKVTIEGDFLSMGAFRYCPSLKEVDLGRTTRLAERTFEYCNALEYITIPETVTRIDAYVFYQCEGLKEITIPDNVTSWNGWVVWTCTSLEKATVGEGLTDTGHFQFYCCYALKELTLGSNISTMSTGTCSSCTSLEKITSLNPTPPSCSSRVFENVPTNTCILYVPKDSKTEYENADCWKDFYDIRELGDDDDADGIKGISVDGTSVENYYSVGGQHLTAPQKGVNIVKYSDGTTKKIIVK